MTGLQSAVIFFGIGTIIFLLVILLIGQRQSKKQAPKKKSFKQYHKGLWYGDESQDEIQRMITEAYGDDHTTIKVDGIEYWTLK